MRLLVCGGRSYTDRFRVDDALDQLAITLLIHGGAPGADSLAGLWAKARGVPVLRFPADWTLHGRAAGPVRNAEMIRKGRPDGVCAFLGSRGTADMVRKAEAAGLLVWRPAMEPPPVHWLKRKT